MANRLTKNLTLLGSIGSIAPLRTLRHRDRHDPHLRVAAGGIEPAGTCARHLSGVVLHRARHHRRGAGGVRLTATRRLVEDYLVDMEEQAEPCSRSSTATGKS